MTDLIVAIVEHVALALLGVGVGIMFNERFVSRKGSAIIGLEAVIVLSIVGQQIATQFSPFLRFVAFVLPPVSHTVYVVGRWGSFGTFDRFLSLLWPFIYSAILMALFVNRLEKKQFDYWNLLWLWSGGAADYGSDEGIETPLWNGYAVVGVARLTQITEELLGTGALTGPSRSVLMLMHLFHEGGRK